MTMCRNVQQSGESEQSLDVTRRDMALAVLGALGASVLTGCATNMEDPELARAVQAATGADVQWVDTVLGDPTLRNGDLATLYAGRIGGTVVIAKGCVTPGDGGGGLFYWATPAGTDDGGTVIVPSTNDPVAPGCWKRIFGGEHNVKWFGAIGSVDDRPGIQAAVDACAAAGGGEVFVPKGIYTVAYGIAVKSSVHLRGAGAGATTIRMASNSNPDAAAIAAYLGNVLALRNVTKARVSALTVDGNRANNSPPTLDANIGSRRGGVYVGGTAWTAERSRDCLLQDLRVTECCVDGIGVAFASGCTGVSDFLCNLTDHQQPVSG